MLQMVAEGIVSGVEICFVGVAFLLCYHSLRVINLTLASIISSSPYVFIFFFEAGAHPALCVLAALGVAIVIALLSMTNHMALNRGGSSEIVHMISSFSIMVIVKELASLMFGSRPRILPVLGSEIDILGFSLLPSQILTLSIGVGLLGIQVAISSTKLGSIMRALWEDATLLILYGVNPTVLTASLFAAAGVLCAGTGLIIGLDHPMDLSRGLWILILGILAAYIGGIHRLAGVWAGGMVLGILRSTAEFLFPILWVDILSYSALIVLVSFKAQGIASISGRVERG